MCALPSVSHDDTKTVVGRKSIVSCSVAPTPTVTNFLVDFVSHTPGLELGRYQAPGAADGPAYTPRTWPKARAEMFKFRTKEKKKVITFLGGESNSVVATVTLYIRDPNDATTPAQKVAVKTDAFLASIYLDGDSEYSAASPTESTLVIESHKDGAVTQTPDADA